MKKIILALAVLSSFVFAKGVVEVHGTSTLHDWVMISKSVDVNYKEEAGKTSVLEASFVIETLKSDDDSLDEVAYETLDVDIKSSISFKLIKQNEDGTLDGIFKIGSKEQKVTVTPDVNNSKVIKGTLKSKMTSFGIEPPTFLFGAMSAGDEVTVKYTIFK